jgi:hypothetical protein
VRLGGKKAAVAAVHIILVIIYHLFAEGTFYDEQRYDRLLPRPEERQRQRALKALEQLGSHAPVERVASLGVRTQSPMPWHAVMPLL